ncbi:MAG: hypothetical protein M0Z94_17505 [Dehalococcoidales bacterium]|nr:hypothetical protein [Dehalococcoidales bacterium]
MSGKSNLDHVMERRAELLAEAIRHRIEVMADFLMPPGEPPVFSSRVSRRDALAFWTKHRYDQIGAQVLSRWSPEQIMALDAELAKSRQAQTFTQGV